MIQVLERFWMDYSPIIVAISAAITLIGAGFTLFKNNSISERSVTRTDQAEKSLSAEHSILLERTADTKAAVIKMQDTIQSVQVEQFNDRAERKIHYASLDDAQKQLADSAGDMGKFAQEFARIAAENQELRQKVLLLEQTIAKMQAQQERRPDPRRDTGWEMEL